MPERAVDLDAVLDGEPAARAVDDATRVMRWTRSTSS
jgi:hypothetical protein